MDSGQDSNGSPVEWNLEKVDTQVTLPANEHPHHGHWELSLQEAQDWFDRRRSHQRRRSERRSSLVLQRTLTGKRWWKFTLRPWDDDEYQDWWFAGTAIPLLAATIGPLANVFSIAALVTYWRMCLVPGVVFDDAAQCHYNGNATALLAPLYGQPYRDPHWCIHLNIVSLVVGFVGNFFLLCNFTGRIRYIIALPVSIIMWFLATGILIGIVAAMAIHVPPTEPQQIYTEGFWYAVLAACMYMICSVMLMVNMLGYFLGHYPQHFNLTDSQRTLILQTMLFFIWLAGGGAIFSAVESRYGTDPEQKWTYVNALYFCDVTILTVGFGDMYTTSNLGRGLLFPYSVGGIIMLGLMVSSISKFAAEIGSENIIQKHMETSRARTVGRTVTTSLELERAETNLQQGQRPTISGPFDPTSGSRSTAITFADDKEKYKYAAPITHTLKRVGTLVSKPQKKPKLLLLREEKDRFEAMRHIQKKTSKWKRWTALSISVTTFGIVWAVGAVVFWRCEHALQGMTYFQALYFCYVSLLTIGYGDLAPQSNAGRPFFVLWSLIAVPTMTILVSDLGSTVINKFKHGTYRLADFTVLPKYGVWRKLAQDQQRLIDWWHARKERKDAKRRIDEGFQVGPATETALPPPTIEELARTEPSKAQLAKRLTKRIRQTADEMKNFPEKRYSYEDWVEITQLIRFTAGHNDKGSVNIQDEEEGLIEWDWIGEDSPMMAKSGEPEFVLDRLVESMHRLVRDMHTVIPESHVTNAESPVMRRRGTVVTADDVGEDRFSLRSASDTDSIENIDPLDAGQSSKISRLATPDTSPSAAGG